MESLIYRRRKRGFSLDVAGKPDWEITVIRSLDGAKITFAESDAFLLAHKSYPVPVFLTQRFCPPFEGVILNSNGSVQFEYSEIAGDGLRVRPYGSVHFAEVKLGVYGRSLWRRKRYYVAMDDIVVVEISELRKYNLIKYLATGLSRYEYGRVVNGDIFYKNRWLMIVLVMAELFVEPHWNRDIPT